MKIKVQKDTGLGVTDSQPISISIRLPKKEEPIKPKIVIPAIKKEEIIVEKEIIQLPQIVQSPKQTYGVIHNEQPVIKQESTQETNKDSILDKIDTGFDEDNALHKDCPKPKFNRHLSKENFLSEFKTEIEKQLARDNLGVYSRLQVDQLIKDVSKVDTSAFVTKDTVKEMIQDLDFVKSSLKSNVDYNIPENLFKL